MKKTIQVGDVFRGPVTGDMITAMRQLPGGRVEVSIKGSRTRLGIWTNNELKTLEFLGRADYIDGAYITNIL